MSIRVDNIFKHGVITMASVVVIGTKFAMYRKKREAGKTWEIYGIFSGYLL